MTIFLLLDFAESSVTPYWYLQEVNYDLINKEITFRKN